MNKSVPSSSHLSRGTAGGRARRTPTLSFDEAFACFAGGILVVAAAYLLILTLSLVAR